MSFVYITEHGCSVGIDGGFLVVKHKDKTEEHIPKGTVEGISAFASVQISSSCARFCMENGVKLGLFSENGSYYGSFSPSALRNPVRIRNQLSCSENPEFALKLSRKLIRAKINNQNIIAKRYLRNSGIDSGKTLFPLRNAKRKVESANSVDSIRGYEGIASRAYFNVINSIIEEPFKFHRRNRRPAVDPFNAMLNLGYSILTKEIIGELENRNVSPYFGVIHGNRKDMPSLACDLIEEWRTVIVDSAVLSMVQGHEITVDGFDISDSQCVIHKDVLKQVLKKLESKMYTEMNYLDYIDKPITFRQAIWHQADRIAKAFDMGDSDYYHPILIR